MSPWKPRMRYLGCENGVMVWESQRIPGDSRVERVTCSWAWFWGGGSR